MNINLFNDIIVFFDIIYNIGIFVNNNSTSYDASSSLPCKGSIEDNMLWNFCVS